LKVLTRRANPKPEVDEVRPIAVIDMTDQSSVITHAWGSEGFRR
jgi:hypothetical protein